MKDMNIVKTISVPIVESIDVGITDGRYDWVHPDITEEHFPHSGHKGGEVLVVEILNTPLSSDDAVEVFKKNKLIPATLEDLLGLGIVEPNLQKRYPIIALSPHRAFPYSFNNAPNELEDFVCGLWRRDGKRTLSLFWYREDWPTTDFYFLTRKI